jgi:hypothetical protein
MISLAALVAQDSRFGTASITYDTQSGLRWLDLTVSRGISWDQAQIEIRPGGGFEGWRHAKPAELLALYNHAGILYPNTQNAADVDAVRSLMTLLGGPLTHTAGLPWQDDRSLALNTVDGDWASGGALAILYFSSADIQAHASSLGGVGAIRSYASPAIGHWLVQSAVPEPSTLGCAAFGILALCCRKRGILEAATLLRSS